MISTGGVSPRVAAYQRAIAAEAAIADAADPAAAARARRRHRLLADRRDGPGAGRRVRAGRHPGRGRRRRAGLRRPAARVHRDARRGSGRSGPHDRHHGPRPRPAPRPAATRRRAGRRGGPPALVRRAPDRPSRPSSRGAWPSRSTRPIASSLGVSLGVDGPAPAAGCSADAATLPETTAPTLRDRPGGRGHGRGGRRPCDDAHLVGDPPDGSTRSVLAPSFGGVGRIGGGGGSGGIKPPRPANPNPNNPNPKPPKPTQKPPTRTTPTRPAAADRCGGGNESTVISAASRS